MQLLWIFVPFVFILKISHRKISTNISHECYKEEMIPSQYVSYYFILWQFITKK